MELSWLMRLRIAAAAAAGVILVGILCWPMVAPDEPFAPISLLSHTVTPANAGILLVTAFCTGLIAYFLAWPYGRQIAPIAVPAGLAFWALRTGDITTLMQTNPVLAQRYTIFAHLMWEPLFWLALVVAGFAGVLAGQMFIPVRDSFTEPKDKRGDKPWKPDIFIHLFGAILGPILRDKFIARQRKLIERDSKKDTQESRSVAAIILNSLVAIVGSVLLALFIIGILAQDVRLLDNRLGSVIGQPVVAQIMFAVVFSFGLVSFLAAIFLKVGYLCPILSTALINAVAVGLYVKYDVVEYLSSSYPASFFTNSVVFVLPIQMVAFGTLGSIAGYWLAVRYNYWRKHEAVSE